jgi:hypothetical protein
MINKIKYSYIPKNNTLDAILSSLAYAVKATGTYEYKLIDNSSSGIRIYPEEIKHKVMRCSSNELVDTINNLVDEDIDLEVILVNGFDISLDELKEKYCDIVKYNDILLCVNNIKELENKDNNISIVIDPDISELDGEEWEETKQEILNNLKDVQELNDAKKNIFDSKNNDSMKSLLQIFGLNSLYDKDEREQLLSKIDEIDIKEQYSHSTQETELIISSTTSGEIMIDCDDEYVTIPKDQIEFLIETLGKLVK